MLHIEHGKISVEGAQPGWWSAHWTIQAVQEEPGYFQIVNGLKPEQRLHIEHGGLEAGVVEPGWHSARWIGVHCGHGYFRIVNKWKPEVAVHIEHGRAEA